jgi:hypothetical protein
MKDERLLHFLRANEVHVRKFEDIIGCCDLVRRIRLDDSLH